MNRKQLLALMLLATSTIAWACADFGILPLSVEVSHNPSEDPRGAWNDIGAAAAATYPQHQGNLGDITVAYKYCALGFICASYGTTFTKTCDQTFEETADAVGEAAERLLNGMAGGGMGGEDCRTASRLVFIPQAARAQVCTAAGCRSEYVIYGYESHLRTYTICS